MAPAPMFLTRDARILDLIRKGDEEGLVLLFREARSPVTDFILRNNGSGDDAEDVLQDALIVLWERVRDGRFVYSSKLSTFVLGVVKRKWLRILAERRREPALNSDVEFASEDDPASDMLIEEERTSLVRSAMSELDERCRKLLLLFYWEDRSMEEIAIELGFSNAATAKSKKYQCKKALEAILRNRLNPEDV